MRAVRRGERRGDGRLDVDHARRRALPAVVRDHDPDVRVRERVRVKCSKFPSRAGETLRSVSPVKGARAKLLGSAPVSGTGITTSSPPATAKAVSPCSVKSRSVISASRSMLERSPVARSTRPSALSPSTRTSASVPSGVMLTSREAGLWIGSAVSSSSELTRGAPSSSITLSPGSVTTKRALPAPRS